MSRIGKLPIAIPAGVQVTVGEREIEVKGPKGVLTTPVHAKVAYEVDGGVIHVKRVDDSNVAKAQHGLRRTLLFNAVTGVFTGYSKTLEVVGVGYKVGLKGKAVELSVGYSHPVVMDMPAGIEAKVEGNRVIVSGIDKVVVGEIAARIRRVRPPEPYKGKGIKYETERVRRKAGKSGK